MPVVHGTPKIAFILLALAFCPPGATASQPEHPLQVAQSRDLQPLTLITRSGRHPFRIELAATAQDRMIGLMHRTTLAPDQGMLFDFLYDQPVRMWMKNTLIPLDMLFLDAQGTVVAVEAMARPGDLTPRGPDQPVRAVLELRGGTAALLGIRPGDRVSHALFPAP